MRRGVYMYLQNHKTISPSKSFVQRPLPPWVSVQPPRHICSFSAADSDEDKMTHLLPPNLLRLCESP